MQSKKALFNLIHFSEENKQDPFITELVNFLENSYPVNLVHYCLGEEKLQVAKEHSYLLNSLKNMPLSSLSFPYLQADLPIYLLWDASLTSHKELFFDMANFSTKVLISPHQSESLADYAKVVLEALSLKKFSVMDIGWALSNSFRSAISSCFLGKDRMEDLQKAKTWKITCCNGSKNLLGAWQATLILNWLTSQMSFKKNFNDSFFYVSSFGKTQVLLEKKTNTSPFYIQLIVESGKNEEEISNSIYELESVSEKNRILCKITEGNLCHLPQVFPLKNMYKSIVHDLFFQSGGEPYGKALQAFCQNA